MPKLAKGDKVKIINDSHPHSGCEGTWTGKVIEPVKTEMLEVEFDRRHLGKRGCFAKRSELAVIQSR